jgi:hypothetical protein
VGAIGYPHGSSLGAVYILFLDKDHEIKSHRVITTGEGGFTHTLKENTCFGSSIARIGDLDGDGVTEIAVGAMGLGKQRGGVFILYMNRCVVVWRPCPSQALPHPHTCPQNHTTTTPHHTTPPPSPP